MDLFEPLTKKITLPACSNTPIKIGGNTIHQYVNKSFFADFKIRGSEYSGLFELSSALPSPFDLIYLKKWNTRAFVPEGIFCLKFKSQGNLEALDENTALLWEQNPYKNDAKSPEDIVVSWAGTFRFKEDKPEDRQFGLRTPQLGALHAISAHFSTNKKLEPATVVLPTGTGKTETMLSTLIYQQCEKLLVVVPSDSLRTQIANKFLTLGCLPELGVVPVGCFLPKVAKLKKGLKTVIEAEELVEGSNVIIATASILNASNQQAINALCEKCSHLFVDEAHHISAKSWLAVRERFEGRKVIQFTATPFRNDGNALGGRIIYNYTMGEAQRAGYFTQVNLISVEEYYDDQSDLSIAKEAIKYLRSDIENGFDHLMMARVDSKSRADNLFDLYKELAPDLKPIAIHSGLNSTEIQKSLQGLLSKYSKIVICVDMLGEGYDLPNLKIAAIHDHHKSLAVTLQFIGRFTRTSHDGNIGQASAVMNVADPGVEGDLRHLYSQGADWDAVLRRLSENRIEREIRLQEVVDALKGKGDLHDQISLWNLKPSYSAMLFSTSCDTWTPDNFKEYLPRFDEYWHSIAEEENILVVMAIQTTPVKWGSYKELRDANYKLLIAHWDQERKALFLFSNDYKCFRVEKMAEALCDGQCELLCGDRIFNVFNGIEYPLVRNLGASQIGAISFTQYFGPNVTDGLSLIEESQSNLSNIAGLGYENGERVIWGCSEKKGKVWSPQKGGAISDWTDWVKTAWDKIVSGRTDEENITKNFLRPKKIDTVCEQHPVSVQWGEQLLTAYEDKVSFWFGDKEVPFYLVDLASDGKEDDGCIRLILSSEGVETIYNLEISKDVNNKGYEYHLIDGPSILVQRGKGTPINFSEYMILDPLMIYYADGSFSYNCYLVSVSQDIGGFSQEEIIDDSWDDVDIRKESMGYDRDADSIQFSFFKSIEDEYEIIINDDGKGEAADLVALKVVDNEIVLTLVHCKYSSKDDPGARLIDLYEVCGQAQRSIRWKHLRLDYLYHHIKHRERLWSKKRYTRFLKGTLADLSTIRNRSRTSAVRFQVVIVQPGVSKANVSEEMLKLLGSTALYIKKTTMADLVVYGSI